MTNQEKKALDYFSGDYNCTQAVLRTVLEEKGVYFDEAPTVAAAFGGGIIGKGDWCGAVTGALMAIGVLSGKLSSDTIEVKKISKEYSIEFMERFQETFNHYTCNGLIGIDRNDPDAYKQASEEGRYKENCPKFVAEAVNIVLEIFRDK